MSQCNSFEIIVTTAAILTAVVTNELFSEKPPKKQYIYRPVGKTTPRDIYSDIYGTPFFQRLVGIEEAIFDHILEKLRVPLSKPRNIHFNYSDTQNDSRRSRKCKLSIENRIIAFLMRMKNGRTHWENAFEFQYQTSSLSRDFAWVAINFDKVLEPLWIRELNQTEKQASIGLIDGMYFAKSNFHRVE